MLKPFCDFCGTAVLGSNEALYRLMQHPDPSAPYAIQIKLYKSGRDATHACGECYLAGIKHLSVIIEKEISDAASGV